MEFPKALGISKAQVRRAVSGTTSEEEDEESVDGEEKK
tara:strand:+ start:109 stop:222 length:114 start_codon:yes stop_codon:yes gene_type:complete